MYKSKKIWIDLDNSPHVLFFSPIIKELKKRNYNVVVTARDYAQVIELADLFQMDYKRIGHHYGKNKFLKVFGLLIRAIQLIPTIIKEKPDAAFSHGSRSQIIIAKIFGLKTIIAFDYEYTERLPFLHPDLALVPESLHDNDIKNTAKQILKYPGIKEDVYIDNFIPDSSVYNSLGIKENEIIVTIRPPAVAAHYHNHKSDILFDKVLEYICSKNNNIRIIITPRTKEQEIEIKKAWSKYFSTGKIIVPEHAMNGLNLLWHSDIVISAGGTMIREAAALGVPAYSIFGGRIGAVDQDLSDTGRLTLISSLDDVKTKLKLEKYCRTSTSRQRIHPALNNIVENVLKFIEKKD